MPYIVLPHLYFCCHPHPSYLLLSLSSSSSIIPHLFCCPRFISFMKHLLFCCLGFSDPIQLHPLPSLLTVPVISRVWFLCPYQPEPHLLLSSNFSSIILYLLLHHPCYHIYATYLLPLFLSYHIYSTAVSIVPNISGISCYFYQLVRHFCCYNPPTFYQTRNWCCNHDPTSDIPCVSS